MKTSAAALLVSLVGTCTAGAERADFKFTMSGDLVDKLEPRTRVLISSPVVETKPNWVSFSIEEMPVTVPFKQLEATHAWLVIFTSPTEHCRVFSIALSRDLFDRPRKIDLKLDRPCPRIRPSGLGRLKFQFHSGITQRMWYQDLPFWDKKRRRLVPAKPPRMSVTHVSDGTRIQDSEMELGCMGSKE